MDHIHRLTRIRDLAQVCNVCFDLFHPISGRPMQVGTKKWAAAVVAMADDLKGEDDADQG